MKRVQSGLRVPYDLNNALIKESERQGFSKNALILQILRNWADSNGMSSAPAVQAVNPAQFRIEMPDGSTPPPLPPAG